MTQPPDFPVGYTAVRMASGVSSVIDLMMPGLMNYVD